MKLLAKYIKDTWNLKKFIEKNFQKSNFVKNDNKETICVVVQPWYGQPVPWVAIVLAMVLNNNKNNVMILFNDINMYKGIRAAILFGLEKVCIKIILNKIYDRIQYVPLSKYRNKQEGNVDEDIVMSIIKINSIHSSRGESSTKHRQEFKNYLIKNYNEMYLTADIFFSQNKIDKCVCAGGLWGGSGIIRHISGLTGAQTMCYDGGDGSILFSTVGASSQQKDIEISFNTVLQSDEDRNYAVCKGREKIEKRITGEDPDLFYIHKQITTSYEGDDYYLMLLNIVWDGAAQGIHLVYEDMTEWILDTIKWILDNTDKKIVIKQHPGERAKHASSRDEYESIIHSIFGRNERIVFIDATSNVTGYELIKSACCVIGFSSSSVVEAVALGKPAIITSNSYFSHLGFVYSAKTIDQYYAYLSSANVNKLKVSLPMMDRACVCNYLTQTCNRLFSCFTTDQIDSWVRVDLSELNAVSLIVEAIETSTPVSLLSHREFMKARHNL